MKTISKFGSENTSTKEVPNFVENFSKAEPVEKEEAFTAERLQEDESLQEKLPNPTGYRIDKEQLSTVVGYVVRLGPDAYKDPHKYPEGAWCSEGDWVIFGRYAGARIQIEGGNLRLLNDDEILAVINNPEDILAG